MAQAGLLFVSEFASDSDWHFRELRAALASGESAYRLRRVSGFLRRYRPGGLSLLRLVNGMWVYARAPAAMLWPRPAAVLCVTSPPCLQMWCALLGWLLRIDVVCWMMDYHPEYEARHLGRWPAGHPLAAALRRLDGVAMRRLRCVIALDAAMADACRPRAGATPVLVFPPWPTRELRGIKPAVAGTAPCCSDDGEPPHVRLLHVGSLGRAHDVEALDRVLGAIGGPCELMVAGCGRTAERVFRSLARRHGLRLTLHGRLPPEQFAALLAAGSADWGLVLLREELAGVVSPSKFTAYLAAGIPLLYIGPPGPTAHEVCVGRGAGLHVPPRCDSATLEALARVIRDPAARAAARQGAAGARDWLLAHDGAAFVRLVQSQLSERH